MLSTFFVDKIGELGFEAMDSGADMDDNIIYYIISQAKMRR